MTPMVVDRTRGEKAYPCSTPELQTCNYPIVGLKPSQFYEAVEVAKVAFSAIST